VVGVDTEPNLACVHDNVVRVPDSQLDAANLLVLADKSHLEPVSGQMVEVRIAWVVVD
jgi:hypothetical protein